MVSTKTHGKYVIYSFEELESTNSHAISLARTRQIFDREIILAKSQSKGRGRLQRQWISPKGNLYFSMILQPKESLEKISQISFVAAIAMQRTISKITGRTTENKWPNDVLLEQKKVAGILLESEISQNSCEFVVLGIGVNIESHPEKTIFPANHLRHFNPSIDAEIVLKEFLDEFEEFYQNWQSFGFSNIRKLWLQSCYKFNQKITLEIDSERLEGIFTDLDLEGNLLLKLEDKVRKIAVADVS